MPAPLSDDRTLPPDPEAQALGRYVRRYSGPPAAVGESARSSIREDAIIQAVGELLTAHPDEVIRVLDACCGNGALAKHLAGGLGDRARRVGYLAFDQSQE